MPMPRIASCILLAGLGLAPLLAADGDQAPEAISPMAQRLDGLPGLMTSETGELRWGGDQGLVITEALDKRFTVASDIGPIQVDRSSAQMDGAYEAIVALIPLATGGGIRGSDNAPLAFGHSFLTGFRIKSGTAIVTPYGVTNRKRLPAVGRGDDLASLEAAIARVDERLADTGLDSTVQRVLADMLTKLAEPDGNQEFDEMPPGYARRLVRHDFLAQALPGLQAADALRTAVAASAAFEPRIAFAGEGCSIDLMANAFGDEAWVFRNTEMVSIATRPLLPEYGWHVEGTFTDCWLIVRWSSDADPQQSAPGGELREALLVRDETVLAAWTAADGFRCDPAVWRQHVPARSANGSELVDDYLPPHIVITNLHGDIIGLAVEGGLLPALETHDAAGVERFLDRAAALLPDAAHLDLIGQYLLRYIYDSPDSTLPFVPGNRTISSDIHQTAAQTLLSTAGGICRGDCDDLSELYHEILHRQGKLAHVLSLPGHAACGWAEKADDGSWNSFVLQTGQALQFNAPALPDSLVMAYKHFSDEETIDPNGLGLLLRFSGENTRSGWRLSWRIFAEPDYAATMIDVQRDWHFQTYQRAIHKMQTLIAAGDHDNANYRELAGLYNFTGQYALAARYLEKALELTPEGDSRLFMSSELFDHWAEAGETEQAEAVITTILDEVLPARSDELGGAAVQVAMELIGTMINNRLYEHIGRVESDYVAETLSTQGDRIIGWLFSQFDESRWQTAGFFRQLRGWLRWHATLAMDVLEHVDRETVMSDPGLAEMVYIGQRYLQYIAPFDADEPSEITFIYPILGSYYRATMGEAALLDQVEASPFPATMERSRKLPYGALRQADDMAWMKVSVPFWWSRIGELYHHAEPTPDPALITRLTTGARAAYEHCVEAGFVNPRMHHQGRLAALVEALISKDAEGLRQHLRLVAEKNDKRLRDDTAQWMGDMARSLDLDWYREVIQIWQEELDYKPKYFWIAWRAMLNHAPDHALIVADAAAARFADDPAFIEEAAFMHALADDGGRQAAAAQAEEILSQAPTAADSAAPEQPDAATEPDDEAPVEEAPAEEPAEEPAAEPAAETVPAGQ